MIRMQPGNLAIILNAKQQVATLCIGERYHGREQFTIRQAFTVTLELDRQGLALRDEMFYLAAAHI